MILLYASEKNRVPSWTDRIVFHGEGITGNRYDRIEVDVSDHKPVYLQAEIKVIILHMSSFVFNMDLV